MDFLFNNSGMDTPDATIVQQSRSPNTNGIPSQLDPCAPQDQLDPAHIENNESEELFQPAALQYRTDIVDSSRRPSDSFHLQPGVLEVSENFISNFDYQFSSRNVQSPLAFAPDPLIEYACGEQHVSPLASSTYFGRNNTQSSQTQVRVHHQATTRSMPCLDFPQDVETNFGGGNAGGSNNASDHTSSNGFRVGTINQGEDRRQMFGTFEGPSDPEVPDLFFNSQNYICEPFPTPTQALRDLNCYHSKPSPLWNDHRTRVCMNPNFSLGSIGNEISLPRSDTIDRELDMLRSRDLGQDIVSALGAMPVGTLNAFLDGNDTFRVLGGEGAAVFSDSAHSNSQDQSCSLGEDDTAENRSGESSFGATESPCSSVFDDESVSQHVESEISSLEECQSPSISAGTYGGDFGERNEHREAYEGVPHPLAEGLPRRALLEMQELANGTCEDRLPDDVNGLTSQPSLGIPVASECSIDPGTRESLLARSSPDHATLVEVTSPATSGAEAKPRDGRNAIIFQNNVFRIKDMWRNVIAFSKRVEKKRQNRGKQLVNLKYYSLKRMEKDLKEILVIAKQIYLAALTLQEQSLNLGRECERERMEIQKLRSLMSG